MIMTRRSGSKLNTWITLEDPELEWIPVLLAKDKENKLAWILLIMAWRLSAMSIRDMNSGGSTSSLVTTIVFLKSVYPNKRWGGDQEIFCPLDLKN